MPRPRPLTPVPPLVGASPHRTARAPRSPSTRVRPRVVPRSAGLLLVAALLLAGTGSATARVVPGPTASVAAGDRGPGVQGSSSTASGAPAGEDPGSSGPADRVVGATGTAGGGPGGPRAAPSWSSAPTPGGWPLRPEPEVVRGFAPPPVAWASGHRGVDLLGRPGQQVRAAQSGTVTFAGRIAGRGVVVVSHGDTRTTYEPVAASVSRGDAVGRGAVLGRLELLGSHCLPRACLHWGLVRDETYLDPLTLVGRGPVRLVPWNGLPTGVGLVPRTE